MPKHLFPYRALFVLVTCIALAPTTASAQITINVQDVVADPGDSNVLLDVHMENQVDVCGFQFDLYYPVQWVVSLPAVAGPQATNYGITVSSSLVGNGTRIIGFSFTNTPIQPGAGSLVSVPVSIFSNAAAGDYPIEASHVIIADCAGNGMARAVINGVLSITGSGDDDDATPGDDDDATPGDDDDATPGDDDDATPGDDDDTTGADDDDSAGDDDDSATPGDDDTSEGDDDDSVTPGDDDTAQGDDDDSATPGDDDDDSAGGRTADCSCSTSDSGSAGPGVALLLGLIALRLRRTRSHGP